MYYLLHNTFPEILLTENIQIIELFNLKSKHGCIKK